VLAAGAAGSPPCAFIRFRLVADAAFPPCGIAVHGVLGLVRAIFMLPVRLLRGPRPFEFLILFSRGTVEVKTRKPLFFALAALLKHISRSGTDAVFCGKRCGKLHTPRSETSSVRSCRIRELGNYILVHIEIKLVYLATATLARPLR